MWCRRKHPALREALSKVYVSIQGEYFVRFVKCNRASEIGNPPVQCQSLSFMDVSDS